MRTVEDVLIESDAGDVLVFMPTERDIRETRDLLETRLGPGHRGARVVRADAGGASRRGFFRRAGRAG